MIVPILCVAVMHLARKCRDRHETHGDSLITENSEQSVQTDDLPPSYSFLFPDATPVSSGTNSTRLSSTSNSSVTVSLVAPTSDMRTRLSSGSLPSLTDYQDAINDSVRQQMEQQRNSSNNNSTSAWRTRFPNMHLSVFDLFRTSSDRTSWTSSPSSPDLSYIQTPPPTYKEAIVIIGCDLSQVEKIKKSTDS